MVVSDSHQNEPSTKRRRCLIGEERKLAGSDDVVEAAEVQRPANKSGNRTVFIGGLHPRIVEAHLEKMCLPYGSIQRLHLCNRKGYAFCQYATPEQAEAAMQALDGRGLLGRRLMVKPAHSENKSGAPGLPWQTASNAPANSGNPDKEKQRIEARIQAVKRKLQDAKSG